MAAANPRSRPGARDDKRIWNVSTAEAARRLGRSSWTVRRWMKAGLLEYVQPGPYAPYMTCDEALGEFAMKHLSPAKR